MTTNPPPGDPGPATGQDGDTGPAGDPGPPPHEGPRVTRDEVKDLGRLRRSSSDKKIAGVAAGVARHLDIDPLVVRIAFVVLAFFGGGGILLYAACWLFVPDEYSNQAVVNIDERSRVVALAIAGVLAALAAVGDTIGGFGFPWPLLIVAGIGVAYHLSRNSTPKRHPGPLPGPIPGGPAPADTVGSPPPPPGSGGPHGPHGPHDATYAGYRPPQPKPVDPTKRGPLLFWFTMALAALGVGVVLMLQLAGWPVPAAAYPAVVMAVCGLMLLVGAFYGRGGGLILVGLVAAVATLFTSVAGEVDAGQIYKQPDTAQELTATTYDLGAGEIKIDLTELDQDELRKLNDDTLDLEVVFGRIEVLVPDEGLAVDATGTVEAGEVKLFGDRSSSTDTNRYPGGDGDDVSELTIDAEVVFGQIEIETAAPDPTTDDEDQNRNQNEGATR